ncbi:MAG: sel1 repeat family protein [Magnetococcales bacterium]|nr:sel1 repeat family protein [Magnetococcales bacterium]
MSAFFLSGGVCGSLKRVWWGIIPLALWLSSGWCGEMESDALRALAVAGNVQAQTAMGLRYLQGSDLPRNEAKAYFWFALAAERGDAVAETQFGLMRWLGLGNPKDEKQGLLWLQRAAAKGDLSGQVLVSLLGGSSEADRATNSETLLEAADYYNLALSFQRGIGVPVKPKEAFGWFRHAAERGHAVAQYQLAVNYYQGQAGAVDHRRAMHWLRRAAQQGDRVAQHNLGVMYYQGQGVAASHQEAIYWFRLAAEKGYPVAQYNLATILLAKKEEVRQRLQGLTWLRAAAEQGYPAAQKGWALQLAADASLLVPACTWLAIAAVSGDQEANRLFESLASRLPEEQRNALRQKGKLWRPRVPDPVLASFWR